VVTDWGSCRSNCGGYTYRIGASIESCQWKPFESVEIGVNILNLTLKIFFENEKN